MIEKLQTAESALEGLMRDLARIEEDLAIKTNSLALDNRCLEIRQKLTNPEFIHYKSVSDENEGVLTQSAKEIEKVTPTQEIIDHNTTEFEANKDLGRVAKNITNFNESEKMMKQNSTSGIRDHNESMLATTYDASYKIGSTNLRSGDLARTLGRSQERYTVTKDKREILVD